MIALGRSDRDYFKLRLAQSRNNGGNAQSNTKWLRYLYNTINVESRWSYSPGRHRSDNIAAPL